MPLRGELVTLLRRARIPVVIAALAAMSFPAVTNGQWLNLPSADIPRTADGKPNLTAPAPRLPDGKPDLSGIWLRSRNYMDGIDPPFQSWADTLFKQRVADSGKDDPIGRCLPWGIPRIGAFSVQKIIQQPRLIVVLYESLTTFRQIFMDGRKLPEDPNPTWMGYSVGRWDGDTLVVETGGFNGKTWLEVRGHPLTDALHVTERMRRRDVGHMEVRVTIDDPKAYTRAWDTTIQLDLLPDTELLEYVCNENEKDAVHLVGK